jgi:hypothetical protein
MYRKERTIAPNGFAARKSARPSWRTLLAGILLGLLFIAAPAAAEDSLPLAIEAYGKTYTIKEFTPATDDKGNTTVTVTGSGFETMPIRGGKTVVPVWCSFTSGDEEYEWENVSVGSGALTFIFPSSKKPEAVNFYAGDKQDKKYKIKCQ